MNGLGNAFYDCNPVGTYDQTQAAEACTAAGMGSCTLTNFSCAVYDEGAYGAICAGCDNGFASVASTCWAFSGTIAGAVFVSPELGGECFCPHTLTTTWD
jgi:hypothetical protein